MPDFSRDIWKKNLEVEDLLVWKVKHQMEWMKFIREQRVSCNRSRRDLLKMKFCNYSAILGVNECRLGANAKKAQFSMRGVNGGVNVTGVKGRKICFLKKLDKIVAKTKGNSPSYQHRLFETALSRGGFCSSWLRMGRKTQWLLLWV